MFEARSEQQGRSRLALRSLGVFVVDALVVGAFGLGRAAVTMRLVIGKSATLEQTSVVEVFGGSQLGNARSGFLSHRSVKSRACRRISMSGGSRGGPSTQWLAGPKLSLRQLRSV